MIKWLFEIDAIKLSTINTTYGGSSYTASIIPESFSNISMRHDISGNGLIAPNDTVFEIANTGSYTLSDFEDKFCTIRLIINDAELRSWKFKIKNVVSYYGKFKCYCTDFLQEFLTGTYPNTQNQKAIWPSNDTDDSSDHCVPVILGQAYIPIKSVNTGAVRYYVLGETETYTISEVKSPHAWPSQSVWTAASYAMTQSTSDGYSLLQPIIHDSDGDGTEDAPGLWPSGTSFLDMLCKYSRSDTSSLTNPAEWIEYILEDFGVDSGDIDATTFAAAETSYSGNSITFNGGFWKKDSREKILSNLLAQVDSYLLCSDSVELHRFSKTSQETITNVTLESFKPERITKHSNDSGTVEWPESVDSPQDVLAGKIVTPTYTGGPKSAVSSEVLEARFLCGQSQNAQCAGMLYFQKKYDQVRKVSFSLPLTALTNAATLHPAQVITINNALYGGSYSLIITQMSITRMLDVQITGIVLNHLYDWGDISPSTVPVVEDDSDGFSSTAKSLTLQSDSYIFKYDANGTPDPDPQTITFTAIQQNLEVSTYNFTTSPNIKSQNTSSNEFTLNDTEFGSETSVQVTVSMDNFTAISTISRVTDGQQGNDGVDATNWSFTGTFSSSDYDTVAWSSGNIYTADTTYTILGSNTGNMTGITYIYFDPSVYTDRLIVVTNSGNAVGANKILIAVAGVGDVDSDAPFQVFGGRGGLLITADNLAANTITANEIAANTITANEISAGTITTSELNFTPVQDSNVIASINASTEGITIQGDNIVLNGDTTVDGTFEITQSNVSDIAGSGINIAAPRYCIFAEPDLPDFSSTTNCTVGQTTWGKFDNTTLKIAATANDAYVELKPTGSNYNIILPTGKKWIISCYVMCPTHANKRAQIYLITWNGTSYTYYYVQQYLTLQSTWYRVSGVIDLSASNHSMAFVRLDNDGGAGCDMYYDGLMLEEQIGTGETPSTFTMPSAKSGHDLTGWGDSDDTSLINGGKIYAGSQIQIGNADGTSDFCVLDSGDIDYYRYISSSHRYARGLKSIEIGSASSGTTVTLDNYYKSPPSIIVSPKALTVYDNSYSGYSQEISVYSSFPEETSSGSCRYTFTPYCTLGIDGYTETLYPGTSADDCTSISSLTISTASFTGFSTGSRGIDAHIKAYGYDYSCIDSDSGSGCTPQYEAVDVQVRLAIYYSGAWSYSAWSDSAHISDWADFYISMQATADISQAFVSVQITGAVLSDTLCGGIELYSCDVELSGYSSPLDTGVVNYIAIGT